MARPIYVIGSSNTDMVVKKLLEETPEKEGGIDAVLDLAGTAPAPAPAPEAAPATADGASGG